MKQQRRTAEEGKEHLLAVMREIHAQVASQSTFTAQRVADAAGISTVWLYKIAGEEFRALRVQYGRKTHTCARNWKKRKSRRVLLPRPHSRRHLFC
jgi:hypothetical protein